VPINKRFKKKNTVVVWSCNLHVVTQNSSPHGNDPNTKHSNDHIILSCYEKLQTCLSNDIGDSVKKTVINNHNKMIAIPMLSTELQVISRKSEQLHVSI